MIYSRRIRRLNMMAERYRYLTIISRWCLWTVISILGSLVQQCRLFAASQRHISCRSKLSRGVAISLVWQNFNILRDVVFKPPCGLAGGSDHIKLYFFGLSRWRMWSGDAVRRQPVVYRILERFEKGLAMRAAVPIAILPLVESQEVRNWSR